MTDDPAQPSAQEYSTVVTATEDPPAVEVDPSSPSSDADSALGDSDLSTLSTSLKSSIFNHRYENGRRYHGFKDGSYLIPDDEEEQSRLDLLHHLFRMMLGGSLHTAPISKNPQHVLDIGTGTGIWAIEMADEYPSARVIGTDLSPIQPTWLPPNCQFYVDDAETEWVYSESFDFIHGRALSGSIADWSKFYGQVLSNLKPGGWFELQEYAPWLRSDDGTLNRAKWTIDWNNEIIKGSELFGKPLDVSHLHKQGLVDAGFEDVREEIIKIPVGPWAKDRKLKEMGQIEQIQMCEAVDAFTPALYTRVLGYSFDQAQVIMEGVKREFNDRKNHWYISYHFVCGRKPMTGT